MALEKAVLTNTVTGERVAVLFNPEAYTLSRDVNYARAAVPGLSAPILQFVNGNTPTLEMELFLDTFEANTDVRQEARRITDLMEIDPDTHAPPILIFAWGSLTFQSVLARVVQQYVLFRSDGVPVRARLQVSFHGIRQPELDQKDIKRQTADYSHVHVVGDGETLAAVAVRVYRDPALWRPIAVVNDIETPAALTPGTLLLVPRLPFQDPDTGEVTG
jgi:nucleoid-associated protein YgaU